MKIGYARISTADQNARMQRDALKAAGCEKIVTEQVSGSSPSRPKLEKLLRSIGKGDVLTVWRLDRLGRSLPHLIEVVRDLEAKGAGFQSLSENIDTTTAGGRLIFHLMGALAEFERSLIVERTQAGLAAARKRGVKVGRPRSLTPAQVKHAQKLIDSGEAPSAVAKSLGVNRSTLYRAMSKSS
jgi:DNA invertase Pin-like site-specific DNA recombinase